MCRIIYFELYADDPERARAFYRKTLGWSFEEVEEVGGAGEIWRITTGDSPGLGGFLMRRGNPRATIWNVVDVPSIDEAVRQVLENGGKEVTPKFAIPGVEFLAYCQDSEGNVFGLREANPRAA